MILRNALICAVVASTAPAVLSQTVAAKVIPAQSEIAFTSKQMGVPVDGRFSRWSADIAFDPKQPESGRVGFKIETGSAAFGAKETDAEVPKPAWFNVAKFPQASFASTSIKLRGVGHYDVAGKLTIKGVTREIMVPVTLTQAASVTTAQGQFALKRTDYKIGEGEWADTSMVADEVQVHFKIALSGVAPL